MLLVIKNVKMKKIFFLLSVFSLFIFSFQAFAAQKIEDVFTDIKKDYIYYNELQSLYDKWVITPDLDGKFNPNLRYIGYSQSFRFSYHQQ